MEVEREGGRKGLTEGDGEVERERGWGEVGGG